MSLVVRGAVAVFVCFLCGLWFAMFDVPAKSAHNATPPPLALKRIRDPLRQHDVDEPPVLLVVGIAIAALVLLVIGRHIA